MLDGFCDHVDELAKAKTMDEDTADGGVGGKSSGAKEVISSHHLRCDLISVPVHCFWLGFTLSEICLRLVLGTNIERKAFG